MEGIPAVQTGMPPKGKESVFVNPFHTLNPLHGKHGENSGNAKGANRGNRTNPLHNAKKKEERELPYIFEQVLWAVWKDSDLKKERQFGRQWVAESECADQGNMRKLTEKHAKAIMQQDLKYAHDDPRISNMQETIFDTISKYFCGNSIKPVLEPTRPIPTGGRRRTLRRRSRRRATSRKCRS